MTRRAMLAALLALSQIRLDRPVASRRFWGPMSGARHRALRARGTHLHVYRFNQDVTNRCRYFDDTPGRERAELFLWNADGRCYIDPETKVTVAVEGVSSFDVRAGAPFDA